MSKTERKSIMLIYGGRGFEREVSLMGAKNLLPRLKKYYDVTSVMIDSHGEWFDGGERVFAASLNQHGGLYYPEKGNFIKIDAALPLLHGDYGEDGVIQGLLDSIGIPYVGCLHNVGAICRSKSTVKCIAKHLEIPILPFVTVNFGDANAVERIEQDIGYPVIVKPDSLGSSIGIGTANGRDDLTLALENAFKFSGKLIVEKLLSPRREIECGYFSAKGKRIFTHPGEIIYGDGLYDYDKKYTGGATTAVSADIDERISFKVREYSRMLVDFLGVRQLSRVDFFLSGEDLYFNEINTMPGFTESSLYAGMLEGCGVDLDSALVSLIEECSLVK